jgi:hypothetical protein
MAIDFLTLLESLADSGLEFVIVGGVAARLHGSDRLTHDVDIVPALDAGTWAKAIDALWDAGARPRIPEPRERVRDLAEVERWIREKGMLALSLRSPDGVVEIDLLVGGSKGDCGHGAGPHVPRGPYRRPDRHEACGGTPSGPPRRGGARAHQESHGPTTLTAALPQG